MDRSKRRSNLIEQPDLTGTLEDQLNETDEPTEGIDTDDAPIATQKHRIITEYVRHVPVGQTTANSEQPKPTPQLVAVSAATDSQAEEDEYQQFIDEMLESSASWSMSVYRLPYYETNGNIDPKSRIRVGELPFTYEYEYEIQRRWARPGKSNYFLIVCRKDGRFYKKGKFPVLYCEPLPPDEQIKCDGEQTPLAIAAAPAAPYPAPIIEHQPPPSPKEQLKEALELVKMVQGITGTSAANPAAVAPDDPEVAVLRLLAKDEQVLDKLSKGLLGKIFNDVKEEADPWAEIAKEALRSGQAVELLQVGIKSLFQGFSGFFPQAASNAPAALIQQQQPQPAPQPEPLPQPQLTPAEQLLSFVLEQCHRNAPAEAVADQILTFADDVHDADPLNDVNWYVRAFALMSTDDALAFVNQSVPGSERITTMPHAKAWTAQLQQLLAQNYETEGAGEDEHQPELENAG